MSETNERALKPCPFEGPFHLRRFQGADYDDPGGMELCDKNGPIQFKLGPSSWTTILASNCVDKNEAGMKFICDALNEAWNRRAQQEERDFTPEEALEEARKRWPNDPTGVFVKVYLDTFESGLPKKKIFTVGVGGIERKDGWIQFVGESFRAAFAAADQEKRRKP